MRKVRIAIAGAGLIGLRHIEETQRSQKMWFSQEGAALTRDQIQNLAQRTLDEARSRLPDPLLS